MCDCEELEFEDFEAILTTLSKKSASPVTEAPIEVLLVQVSKTKQRK